MVKLKVHVCKEFLDLNLFSQRLQGTASPSKWFDSIPMHMCILIKAKSIILRKRLKVGKERKRLILVRIRLLATKKVPNSWSTKFLNSESELCVSKKIIILKCSKF